MFGIPAQIVMKVDAAATPEMEEGFAADGVNGVDVPAKRSQQPLLFPVSPVSEAANGRSLSRIPGPLQFPRRAVERHNATRGRNAIQYAVDDDRLGLKASARRAVGRCE